MSIINGSSTSNLEEFERLKLVATLAAIIYADPSSGLNMQTAVLKARAILSAADDSLIQNPDLRCEEQEAR